MRVFFLLSLVTVETGLGLMPAPNRLAQALPQRRCGQKAGASYWAVLSDRSARSLASWIPAKSEHKVGVSVTPRSSHTH